MLKVLFILTLLFLATDARHKNRKHRHDHKIPRIPKVLPFIPKFPSFPEFPPHPEILPFRLEPYNNNFPYNEQQPEEENKGGFNNEDNDNNANFPNKEEEAKPDFQIDSNGHWDLINQDSGVSAMHINLLPTNKIIVYDSKIYRPSRLNLPDGVPCIPYKDDQTKEDKQDCSAHAMEYDIETNEVTPLRVCVHIFFSYFSFFFLFSFHILEVWKKCDYKLTK